MNDAFQRELKNMGYEPNDYLQAVRKKARREGYRTEHIEYANDGVHKVQIHTPTGQTIKFGRVGYGDFLIWTHREKHGDVPRGFAEQKRNTFQKSHLAMRGAWKSNPYSRNRLALALLW